VTCASSHFLKYEENSKKEWLVDDLKRIGIGIIGCGSIAQKVHVPCFIRTPECELVALADTNLEVAKELALKNNIKHVFNDYRELLECDNVDAVSVCTPPATHCQIVLDACKSQKHVLCEKPMALSLEDADQMIAAAKRADVILAIGHQFRFMRNVQKARELLRSKAIGQILSCYGELIGGGPFFDWKTSSNYFLKAGSGIDVLFNYGTHVIDLFNFFFKKALRVSGFVKERQIQNIAVGDRSIVTIEYENDILATLNSSYTAFRNPDGGTINIYGVDGKLSMHLTRPILGLYKHGSFLSKLHGTREIVCGKKDFLIPYKREIRNFVESIVNPTEPYVSGIEGRHALEIALAAYQSYISQRTLTLPLKSGL
jgi:UDP-N-acetylglucosamine 3-dehydrogenase